MSEGQIVVTGGSRGIGAAIAVELDRRGRRIACLSRSGEAPVGYGLACDMTDEAKVAEAIAAIAAKGPIAGLVNNAGHHVATPSESLTAEEFERSVRLNATAVVVACREAYPHIRANGGGLIINIGSFFDKLGVAQNVAYCASKAAVGAITRCLAVEWADAGIRVLDVAPGYIDTDLNHEFLARDNVRRWLERRVPVKRPGSAEEVARLVGTLYSEDIGFLTGETIYMDGGQGMNH
ncbi:SDR family NAD(P)-dependent oxidoreductase [Lutibaculum baratangense]|uniref:3-oxoacyl-[acyl-carrier protein] reductase n=1 Tax=Lutibaculum baratangense AMV1 TaxID=631454 RepID=V4RKK8_9HYPH|nr:SDR family oxidoreductase [Lutibaculum baratangense]ESR23795.1 3-oxoacyl-[acyl-carrier protein] reductase [Lutibaculum baratangense AMV1]